MVMSGKLPSYLIDQKVFEELFHPFGQGSSRFNLAAEDLNHILPVGWSERAPSVPVIKMLSPKGNQEQVTS